MKTIKLTLSFQVPDKMLTAEQVIAFAAELRLLLDKLFPGRIDGEAKGLEVVDGNRQAE